MQVVALKYASAEEIAATLNQLLEASARAAAARGGGCVLRLPDAPIEPPQSATLIGSDPWTNSLLVQATPEDLPQVLELIERLDQQIE